MLSGIWTAVGLHNSRLALAVWLLLWSAQVASVSSGSDDSCNTPGGIIYVVQLAGQGCMAIQAACKCVCGKKCQHLLTVHSGIASHLFGADYIAAELKLSASVAAGLINRHMQAPTVVTMLLPTDQSSAASARAEESTMRSCTWSELTVPELWRLAYTTGKNMTKMMVTLHFPACHQSRTVHSDPTRQGANAASCQRLDASSLLKLCLFAIHSCFLRLLNLSEASQLSRQPLYLKSHAVACL